ncbi:hypothetical protein [Nonomuraea sp. 10N515B]|uniref:hypothetical protein n=1 Tax=Nonomuraea sp. 10N515B TaxID=3457422 RepID=UPI003FCCF3E4
MNRISKAHILLAFGWVILIVVGWAAYFGGTLDAPATVALVAIGLGCFLTAVVVAINDR